MLDDQIFGLFAGEGRNLTDQQIESVAEDIKSIPEVWHYILNHHSVSWYDEDINSRIWGRARSLAIERKLKFLSDDQFRLSEILRQRARCASEQ